MISPRIKWDHSDDYFVPTMKPFDWFNKRYIQVNASDPEFEFLQGHIIDGTQSYFILKSKYFNLF